MEQENHQLSICIPTYNRSQLVARTVKKTIEACRGLSGVDIVVSDNASEDDTQEQISTLAEGDFPITYVRQEENLGFDRNVDQVVRAAKGRFCWILSDDDDFDPMLPAKLLDVISQYPDAVHVFIDYEIVSTDTGAIKSSAANLQANLTEVFGCKAFCESTKVAYSFVSSIVVRRESWLALPVENYFDTQFIHIFAVHELVRNQQAILLGDRLLKMMAGPVSTSRAYNSIDHYFKATFSIAEFALNLPLEERRDGTASVYLKAASKDNTWQIVVARRLSSPPFEKRLDLSKLMFPFFKGTVRYWLLDLPMLLMPHWVFRLLDGIVSLRKKLR